VISENNPYKGILEPPIFKDGKQIIIELLEHENKELM